jgi:peptide deformylase
MRTIMRTASGVGLAAPQIGIPSQIFVAEYRGLRLAVANPVLTLDSDLTVWLTEGCLSLPKKTFLVPRAEHVTLAGFDVDTAAPFVRSFSGFEARIIQHEMHHLEGTLIDTAGSPA